MLRHHAIPAPARERLERLSSAPALQEFALGDGTSLALRFGHRLSVDLDYFTRETFDPESLFAALPLSDVVVVARSNHSLNAIANRGSKKDFHDLCELAKHHPLAGMLDFFEAKYRNADRFIVLRSLACSKIRNGNSGRP